MTTARTPDAIPPYRRCARGTFTIWAFLVTGAVFMWAGAIVDPATNCDGAGNCAPWLVPMAYGLGILATATALGQLWANPESGSMIDPATGDLVWWQNRLRSHPGDEGRIAPADIGMIRIAPQSDDIDLVSLYDRAGIRQPYFDAAVIPPPYRAWANRLAAQFPHIAVKAED